MSKDLWPSGYGMNNDYREPKSNVIDKLKMRHDISNSVLCSVLGISEIRLWKIQKNVKPLPPHYEAKLRRFLDYLEEKQRSG